MVELNLRPARSHLVLDCGVRAERGRNVGDPQQGIPTREEPSSDTADDEGGHDEHQSRCAAPDPPGHRLLPLDAFGLVAVGVVAGRGRLRDEGLFGGSEFEGRGIGPGLVVNQPLTDEQIVGVAFGCVPLVHGGDEGGVVDDVGAGLVDPLPQAGPLGEKGLVGDLDRGGPGHLIAVEGE